MEGKAEELSCIHCSNTFYDWKYRVKECPHCGIPWINPPDPINHPSHYTAGDVECIDAIRAALGPEGFQFFCRGQLIKYAWRAGLKGDAATDLAKAETYARFAREKA